MWNFWGCIICQLTKTGISTTALGPPACSRICNLRCNLLAAMGKKDEFLTFTVRRAKYRGLWDTIFKLFTFKVRRDQHRGIWDATPLHFKERIEKHRGLWDSNPSPREVTGGGGKGAIAPSWRIQGGCPPLRFEAKKISIW